jgi:hypothetical protein
VEELILSVAKELAFSVCVEKRLQTNRCVPLSDNAVFCRIQDMAASTEDIFVKRVLLASTLLFS